MKRKIALCFSPLLAGFVLATGDTAAQTIAYRQANLASRVTGLANHPNASLQNPWGIAFLPGHESIDFAAGDCSL